MEKWVYDLSRALQRGRKNMNLTQQKLAEMIQKSTGAVGQFERGDSVPSVETLHLLMEYLGIEANDLFPESVTEPACYAEVKALMRHLDDRDQQTVLHLARHLYHSQNSKC